MLSFLTDAHISPDVAEQINAKRPDILIQSLHEWHEGALLHAEDDVILNAALEAGLTLVTYDQRSIFPLITQWGLRGRNHAGLVFINRRTIAQSDIGSQIRGLIALWDDACKQDWMNITTYLNKLI